jgi:nitrite reductase (cytochrome c-552)
MTEAAPRPRSKFWYLLVIVGTAAATMLLTALLMNIFTRKQEGQQFYFPVAEIGPDETDPEVWGRNFPRQYKSYLLTAENRRATNGGSEAAPVRRPIDDPDPKAPSKLEADKRLVRIFAGYPFSVDYRERRGHAFMLVDQKETERVKQFKQPGACLQCHASVIPTYREKGDGDIQKGFEIVCKMPIQEAWTLVKHPVSCIDCHDPKTLQLRVQRPAFLAGIKALAASDDPVPHLKSIELWREKGRKGEYDVNALASRQEMRSFVCAQCHVEYYFKGENKLVTYPWHRGLKADQIEQYYDKDAKWTDYTHAETKAKILKAQHPEFEMWSQGIHARAGVACADCHMPYVREGAVKVSDHQVRSPMLNTARACQTCHRSEEKELEDRVRVIQKRTRDLMDRAENAVIDLIDAIKAARTRGATDEQLAVALERHRQSQWRVDFVNAENSMGFHAPQEAARLLGEAIDYARQGEVQAVKAGSK